MERIFTGSIKSSQLGNIGTKYYGFISVETEEKEHLKVKVAASTKYDTLDIGRRVHIVAENIGDMNVLTAKSIARAD
ncbi:MAG: hypothetical protein ACFFFK_04970 [Candidatus Thorarchaeota archaeon]